MYKPPRNIFLLGLTSFLNDASSEMVLSIFPAFFTSVLKTGAASLGLVEGIADTASNVIKIYAGRLSDTFQKRKPFMVAGYTLAVCIRPFYMFTHTVAGVAGLRVLDRVGKGLREGPRDAIISLSTPKEALGRAFGFHRAMDTAGAIIGPLIAYLILRQYPDSFNTVFVVAFIIGLFAILSTFLVKDIVSEFKKKNLSLEALSYFSSDFKKYLFALFLFSIGSIPVAVLLLKTQSIGLAIANIPLFYMLYNLSYAAFSFSAGGLSDRIGPRRVLLLGYAVLILGYIVLAYAESVAVLVCGFLVLGLFPALTDGVVRAFASALSPEERRGGALGLTNAVTGMGLLIAGILGGYLWQESGPATACIVAGVFVAAGALILMGVRRQNSEPQTFEVVKSIS
jgi:MFS family permease